MILRSAIHYRVLLLGCLLTVAVGVACMTVSLDGLLATSGGAPPAGPPAAVPDPAGGEFRAQRDTPDPGGLLTVLALSTVISGLLTVGVTATTLGLAVSLRRRDLALFRLAGAGRARMRRLVVGEALLVAVPAAGIGLLAGRAVSGPVLDLVSSTELAEVPIRSTGSWLAGAAAAGLGLLTALVAGWAASTRAVAVSPAEALRDADVDRQLLTLRAGIAGGVLLTGGVVMLALTRPAGAESAIPLAVFGTVAVTAAVALLGPVLLPPVVRVAGALLRVLSGSAVVVELATRSAGAARRRTSSLMAPTLALLAVIGGFSGVLATVAASGAADERARTTATAVVSRADGAPLSPSDLERLEQQPGMEAVSAPTTLPVLSNAGQTVSRELVQVGDPGGWAATHRLPVVSGSLELAAPTDVLVSAEIAGWYQLGPGDTFDLGVFGGPTSRVRIGGVVDPGPAATPVLARADLPGADQATPPGSAWVVADRSPIELSADLAPAGLVASAPEDVPAVDDDGRANQQVLAVLAVPGAVFSLVAVVSTAVMTIDRRRQEIATLRRLGTSRDTVLGQLALEAVLVAVGAAVLAVLLVLVGVLALVHGLGSTHLATEVALPWALLLPLAGFALVAAVLAHLLPGLWVLRGSRPAG